MLDRPWSPRDRQAERADWPQWRGPHRDGISQETGLLDEWPADGPTLVWQIDDVGYGYSTPAVVGDRLYLMGNKGKEDEFCGITLRSDGKPVWSTRVGKVGTDQQPPYPAARSTPTVDGDVLYRAGLRRRPGLSGDRHRQDSLEEEPARAISAASRANGLTPSRRWSTATLWSARRAAPRPRSWRSTRKRAT